MHKKADVNIYNPTGMFPSRFLSFGFYIFQIYSYIKYQKFPHSLLQKQTYTPPPFLFLFSPSLWINTIGSVLHVSNLQASVIS